MTPRMTVVYANQLPPTSWTSAIFLAGPTPRKEKDLPPPPSWRPAALKFLEVIGYKGVVFVPEDAEGTWLHNYDNQIEWEEKYLNMSDVIIFWIPRELLKMPGYTTNDEWGNWKMQDPLKVVLGTPPDAPKVRYQRYYAEKFHIPVFDNLEATCAAAIAKIGDTGGTRRTNGERSVPLHIWRTASFQSWYKNLVTTGNRLDDARVVWVFRVGPKLQFVLFWALHVDIYIAAENRHKMNEVVIGRPDISTILLYERREPLLESRLVIVQEFRSPVSNASGYVFELAGGSSWKQNQNPFEIMVDECKEEAGVQLSPDRFVQHEARQLAATTVTHRAHLFSAELTAQEMDVVADSAEIMRGVEKDSERTWARVFTYGELLAGTTVDWSMIGMIASVLR